MSWQSALSRVLSVVGSSSTRGSSFFIGKVTALGVLCCFAKFVCLTLLASFFLPSHLSFKNMYIYTGEYGSYYIVYTRISRDSFTAKGLGYRGW